MKDSFIESRFQISYLVYKLRYYPPDSPSLLEFSFPELFRCFNYKSFVFHINRPFSWHCISIILSFPTQYTSERPESHHQSRIIYMLISWILSKFTIWKTDNPTLIFSHQVHCHLSVSSSDIDTWNTLYYHEDKKFIKLIFSYTEWNLKDTPNTYVSTVSTE